MLCDRIMRRCVEEREEVEEVEEEVEEKADPSLFHPRVDWS